MPRSINKQTVRKGMWWIKGKETKKFAGILTYGDGYLPILEIFPKEYEFMKQLVPDGSTVYGDVFLDSKKLEAVTLLDCSSRNSPGRLTVGAYIYKQEFVYANCAAIGLLLDDSEIAQLKSPQRIFLTCPGLDDYSMANAIEYVWKGNIPQDRVYRTSDLDRIVFTQPEPIEIDIDIGKISISLGASSTARDLSSRYSIHIILEEPVPETEANALIYSQFLTFVSIMTGRLEYFSSHSVEISTDKVGTKEFGIDLNYGHPSHEAREPLASMFHTLLLGTPANMRKFASLFPIWRENFAFVEEMAFHYLRMVDYSTETNLLQTFSLIEKYALDRLLEKHTKGMQGILEEVIKSNAAHYHSSEVHARHFPAHRKAHLAEQLANYRHNCIHPKSNKECRLTTDQVYAYVEAILRSVFLREMGYAFGDVDKAINHWWCWRDIERIEYED